MPAPVSTTLVLSSRDSIGKRVRDIVHQALERRGVKPVEIDTVAGEEKLANEVMGAIKGADLIIADLSGNNPNVLYELGFAHALRKPTVLLRSTKSELPVPLNLQGFQVLVYDPDDPSELEDLVGKVAARYVKSGTD